MPRSHAARAFAVSAPREIRATGAAAGIRSRHGRAVPRDRGTHASRLSGSPAPDPGARMPSQGLALSNRLRYLAWRVRRIDVGSVLERAKETVACARQVDAGGAGRHALVGRFPAGRLPGLRRLRLRDPEPRRAGDLHDASGVERAVAEVRPPRLPWPVPGQGRVRPHVQRLPPPRLDGRRGGQRRGGARLRRESRHDRHQGARGPGGNRRAPLPRRRRRGLGRVPPRPPRARRAADRGSHPPARRPRRGLPGDGQHHQGDGLLRRREDAHPRDGAEVRTRRGERPDDVRRLLHDARRERPRRRPGLRLARARPRRSTPTAASSSPTSSCR